VMDATGAVLPGAAVMAICSDTNFTRTVVTDAQGGFRIPELPVCTYRVTAELQGVQDHRARSPSFRPMRSRKRTSASRLERSPRR